MHICFYRNKNSLLFVWNRKLKSNSKKKDDLISHTIMIYQKKNFIQISIVDAKTFSKLPREENHKTLFMPWRRSISRSSLEKPSPNIPPNPSPRYNHETLPTILTHESVSKMWAECRQYSIREQCRGALLQKRPSKSDVRYKDYCDEREQGLRSFQEDDPLAVPSTSHYAPRSRLF